MKSVWMTAQPTWHSIQLVTPFSLAWISLACLGLIVAALGFLARDVLRGPDRHAGRVLAARRSFS